MRASKHWLHQRITAVVLCLFIPGFWWLFKSINTSSYQELHVNLCSPIILIFITVALAFILHHARLGLSVIIEDYTQQLKRKILLHVSDLVLLLITLGFIYSILKLLKGI
jgi:succinate dehydrogenase / fumarate reductase membrane anchor subunit